jgi:hypothetical protein
MLHLPVRDQDSPFISAWRAKFDTVDGSEEGHLAILTDPETNKGILRVIKVKPSWRCRGFLKKLFIWAPVALTCNPSYLGGWVWEDWGLRPAWANSSWDPISKITKDKWTGDVAQKVGCLLCKCKALNSNPSPTKNIYVYIWWHWGSKPGSLSLPGWPWALDPSASISLVAGIIGMPHHACPLRFLTVG